MSVQELAQSLSTASQQYKELLQDLQEAGNTELTPIIRILQVQLEIHDEVIDLRLKKILYEERPYLPVIDIDKISHDAIYDHCSLPEISETFLELRCELSLLLSKIPQDSWGRTGVHQNEGHITFKELVRRMVKKDVSIINRLQRELTRV